MDSLKSQFTQNLRQLRELRGFSQEKLAEKVGVSLTFIAHLETGRKSPSFETLEALGKALGVHPYRLLIPAVPVDEGLVDAATEGLRDVVRRMFLVVNDASKPSTNR